MTPSHQTYMNFRRCYWQHQNCMMYDHRTNFEYHIDHHDYTCYSYKEPMIVVCSSEQFNMALSPSKYCVVNVSEKIALL
jgi:hypothetical protein